VLATPFPWQDIGFDKTGRGGWDNTVINIYFHEHFPKAVRSTSRRLPCACRTYAFLACMPGSMCGDRD
jgi:hypothetical protein